MILQILTAEQAVPVTNVTFGIMDVVEIVGGVITLLSVYFILRYKVEAIETKLKTHMEEYNKNSEAIHVRIDDTEDNHAALQKEVGVKHQDLKDYMQQMEIRIIKEISKIK